MEAAGYTHAQAMKMAKKAYGGNLVGGNLVGGNLVGGKQKYLKYKWFLKINFINNIFNINKISISIIF